MKSPVFTGTCTALVTPFSGGAVNLSMLDRLIDRQLAAKVSALVICGTTGEAASLRDEEKLTLIQHAVRYVDGRCKILAGTGTNDTAHAIRLSQMGEACGADALLVVTPYYNKTTQAGLANHFTAIADSVSIPVVLYNVPSRTGMDIALDTYRALAGHPNINGVKEASGKLAQTARIRGACGDALHIWSGCDEHVAAMMALGAKGVISVCSNLVPQRMVQLVNACLSGDFAAAGAQQVALMPLIDALFAEVNPIPIKAALQEQGLDVGPCRAPLSAIGEAALARLRAAIAAQ